MLKSAVLALSIVFTGAEKPIETPPLSFIAIDCTKYGKIEEPYLILSHDMQTAIGPLMDLAKYPEALELFNIIMALPHEEFIDPTCKISVAINEPYILF